MGVGQGAVPVEDDGSAAAEGSGDDRVHKLSGSVELVMSSARYRRGVSVWGGGPGTLIGDQQLAAMTEPP